MTARDTPGAASTAPSANSATPGADSATPTGSAGPAPSPALPVGPRVPVWAPSASRVGLVVVGQETTQEVDMLASPTHPGWWVAPYDLDDGTRYLLRPDHGPARPAQRPPARGRGRPLPGGRHHRLGQDPVDRLRLGGPGAGGKRRLRAPRGHLHSRRHARRRHRAPALPGRAGGGHGRAHAPGGLPRPSWLGLRRGGPVGRPRGLRRPAGAGPPGGRRPRPRARGVPGRGLQPPGTRREPPGGLRPLLHRRPPHPLGPGRQLRPGRQRPGAGLRH